MEFNWWQTLLILMAFMFSWAVLMSVFSKAFKQLGIGYTKSGFFMLVMSVCMAVGATLLLYDCG